MMPSSPRRNVAGSLTFFRDERRIILPLLERGTMAKKEEKKAKPAEAPLEACKLVDPLAMAGAVKNLRGLAPAPEPIPSDPDQLRRILDGQLAEVRKGKPTFLEAVDEPAFKVVEKSVDCLGLYPEPLSADCPACPDIPECVKVHVANLADGFAAKAKALGIKLKEAPKQVEKRDWDEPALARVLVVYDLDASPYKPGSSKDAKWKILLKHGSGPLSSILAALRKGGFEEFDPAKYGEACCFAEDLPDEVKASLPKAVRKQLGL
jgi:hypothetical protein